MALENSMLVMNGKQVGGNTQDLTGYQTKVDNNLETESKEIAGAINELRSEKADTDIVAADFNAGTSYTAGNYCIYEGKFYKFKASHTGAWSAADVDEIKIAGELASLKSGLTELTANDVSGYDDITASTQETSYVCPTDGYLYASSESDTTGVIRVVIMDSNASNVVGYIYMNVADEYQIQTLYLKKGFKVYVSSRTANAVVHFNKLA